MSKLKSIIIGVAVAGCPFLAFSGTSAGEALRSVAYFSAGAYTTGDSGGDAPEAPADNTEDSKNDDPPAQYTPSEPDNTEPPSEPVVVPTVSLGQIITKNRLDYVDNTDYSAFKTASGEILRYNYGKYNSFITLESGAQVQNCTDVSSAALLEASYERPAISLPEDSAEPVVLIYHTHTTESFLPEEDWYDASYPINTLDGDRSIVSVGDAICEALAARGISVVHDCTVHNYPQHTGSYYLSAETIQKNLEEYPSIQLVLDIHRDGITNADGSLVAPIAEINGKNAAQFMIISGCANEVYNIPNYIENYKLACLLQNCAENAYPTLARPVLFDYRNYNQDLSTGALLIEVGSHGNSLEEALYTGELLGNIIADALEALSE